MKALIAYWKMKLDWNKWLMSHEDKVMIQQTIKALRDLEKLRATTRVEMEAEIVRTVTQLSNAREGAKKLSIRKRGV